MKKGSILTLVSLLAVAACQNDDGTPTNDAVLKNYSVNPSLVKTMPGFENLEVFTLISSDDKLEQSPNFV